MGRPARRFALPSDPANPRLLSPGSFPFASRMMTLYTAARCTIGSLNKRFETTKIGNMKHWIAGLFLALVLILTGCDTVNHSQIQIRPPQTERGMAAVASVPSSERAAVKQVLTEIATRRRFEDRTELSLIPDTICSYAQPDVKNPIRIVAWASKERILIDLFQKPPETGETEAYRKLREEIMSTLNRQFDNRLTLVHKMDQVSGPGTP